MRDRAECARWPAARASSSSWPRGGGFRYVCRAERRPRGRRGGHARARRGRERSGRRRSPHAGRPGAALARGDARASPPAADLLHPAPHAAGRAPQAGAERRRSSQRRAARRIASTSRSRTSRRGADLQPASWACRCPDCSAATSSRRTWRCSTSARRASPWRSRRKPAPPPRRSPGAGPGRSRCCTARGAWRRGARWIGRPRRGAAGPRHPQHRRAGDAGGPARRLRSLHRIRRAGVADPALSRIRDVDADAGAR